LGLTVPVYLLAAERRETVPQYMKPDVFRVTAKAVLGARALRTHWSVGSDLLTALSQ
jgi:hypothetical protein